MGMCPHCGSQDIYLDTEHGFKLYWCASCGNSWTYTRDDSDYDEAADEVTDLLDDPGKQTTFTKRENDERTMSLLWI